MCVTANRAAAIAGDDPGELSADPVAIAPRLTDTPIGRSLQNLKAWIKHGIAGWDQGSALSSEVELVHSGYQHRLPAENRDS